jgi:hypothetical protein
MDGLDATENWFLCEICGERSSASPLAGMDATDVLVLPIRMCSHCGPVYLELMQLCRELALDCLDN